MPAVEIPLSPTPQRMTVTLAGVEYRLRVTFNEAGPGIWNLDIGTVDGTLLLAGVPLLPGLDLLGQYAYLGLGGSLYLVTDRSSGELPTFDGLGLTSHLYFVTPD